MSDKPIDPAAETTDKAERTNDTYDGQKGYGVQYEGAQDLNGNFGDMPAGGRSGSYDSQNEGGYGSTGHSDAKDQSESIADTATTPGNAPDQGQGL